VGYTWHESTQLIEKLTSACDFDYIHLSMPAFDAKPTDSDKTFAELFQPAIGEKAQEVIVGDVMTNQAMQAALAYTDLVAMARATLIDPQIGLKVTEGREDDIVRQISPAQVKQSRLTPGLINLFSDPKMEPHLPGRESIYELHETGSLGEDIIKNGTGTSYNLADFEK